MARLIFKSPYYKPKGKVKRGGYAKYIATREGVELLRSGMADYINERRGSNGLFSDEGVVINLAQIEETINNHSGNVWGLIFSLKRADAERFGYNSAEQWMNLLRSHRNDIAKEMHIAPGDLRWYAAYHNNETHPHVHMLVWSERAYDPYLSKVGIQNIKRTVANDIFKRDLIPIYKKQTQIRDDIKAEMRSRISEIVSEISYEQKRNNWDIIMKFESLSKRLSNHKGKKVYGYLDKDTKKLVNEIVALIAENDKISESYDLWHKYRCEIFKTYTDVMPEWIPLEENEEFKSIRNEVIRMASELQTADNFFGRDDLEPDDDVEEEDFEELLYWSKEGDENQMYLLGRKYLEEQRDATKAERWLKRASDNGCVYAMYFFYKCYRDKRIEDKENEKMKYLQMALEEEYTPAEYEYAKLLMKKDPKQAERYLRKAADNENPFAAYAYGKMCAERGDSEGAQKYFGITLRKRSSMSVNIGLWYYYGRGEHEIGKSYLQYGKERSQDAAYDALKAIERGENYKAVVDVLNLLYYVSNIIDDRADRHKDGMSQSVDRKLKKQIRKKNQALGLKMSM